MSKIIFLEPEDDDLIAKFFTFKTISVTSSLTPSDLSSALTSGPAS